SLGLLLVNTIKPGKLIDNESRTDNRLSNEIWATSQGHELKDGINYLNDPNLKDRVEQISKLSNANLSETSVSDKIEKATSQRTVSPLQPLADNVPESFSASLSNIGLMLQIIFSALLFGICSLLIDN